MTTLPHERIRQRTIPARIWRILASLNDMAGLTETDWLAVWRVVLWIVRLVLIVAAVSNLVERMLSYSFIALVGLVAVNTLPGSGR